MTYSITVHLPNLYSILFQLLKTCNINSYHEFDLMGFGRLKGYLELGVMQMIIMRLIVS